MYVLGTRVVGGYSMLCIHTGHTYVYVPMCMGGYPLGMGMGRHDVVSLTHAHAYA